MNFFLLTIPFSDKERIPEHTKYRTILWSMEGLRLSFMICEKEVGMKRLNRFFSGRLQRRLPVLLTLLLLAGTAACGRKEQDEDDMVNGITETSQAADETAGGTVSEEQETAGINGSGLGTTGRPAGETMEEAAEGTTHETMEETAGGNSTANESSEIIDDTGNIADDAKDAVHDAGSAVENAADHVGDAVKDVIDGAGDVVKDAAEGAADGIRDMTGSR